MKYIYFFLFSLILFACKQKDNVIVPLKCKLSSDTVRFHLDMNQFGGKMAGSFHDTKTKQDYVYFGNEFDGIEVFDTKGKKINNIPINKSLPNLPSIESVQFIALDSILIFPGQLNSIFLLDEKGNILKIIELPKYKLKSCEIEYGPTMGKAFYDKGSFFVKMDAYPSQTSINKKSGVDSWIDFTNKNIQLPYCQEIKGVFSDSIYFGKPLPFKLGRFVQKNTFYIPFNKSFIAGENLLVTNIHSDSLFVFRLTDFKLLQATKIKSDYNKKIGVALPLIDSVFFYSSDDIQQNYLRTSALITDVIYNPVKKLYHIQLTNHRNSPKDTSSFSLITLDENLNKVNEQFFSQAKYSRLFLINGDLWLNYHSKKEHAILGKQTVTLIRLDYEEK